jgi:hypothetical protein
MQCRAEDKVGTSTKQRRGNDKAKDKARTNTRTMQTHGRGQCNGKDQAGESSRTGQWQQQGPGPQQRAMQRQGPTMAMKRMTQGQCNNKDNTRTMTRTMRNDKHEINGNDNDEYENMAGAGGHVQGDVKGQKGKGRTDNNDKASTWTIVRQRIGDGGRLLMVRQTYVPSYT